MDILKLVSTDLKIFHSIHRTAESRLGEPVSCTTNMAAPGWELLQAPDPSARTVRTVQLGPRQKREEE